MAVSVNPELATDIVRYTYSSLTTPTTVYDYDVRTGEKTLLKRDPVMGSFDPANYQTEFLFAPARGRQAHTGVARVPQRLRRATAPRPCCNTPTARMGCPWIPCSHRRA